MLLGCFRVGWAPWSYASGPTHCGHGETTSPHLWWRSCQTMREALQEREREGSEHRGSPLLFPILPSIGRGTARRKPGSVVGLSRRR